MINLNILLGRVATPAGFPFPKGVAAPKLEGQVDHFGFPVVKVTDESLGKYEFMPVVINDGQQDFELQNPLIMISGEKGVVETEVTYAGTVFQTVFQKPYDISIITTILSKDHKWPKEEFKQMVDLYNGARTDVNGNKLAAKDLVTLKCALTNYFLQPEDNFIITRIGLLDNGGAENMEVLEFVGRSNVDFELLIK